MGMDEAAICEKLDGTIVTDEEFALGPDVWTSWTKLIMKKSLRPEDEGKEMEFTIDLVKTDRDKIIGFKVDESKEDIVITHINPEGLVHKWNTEKSSENPDLVVKEGYCVVAVNGVKGHDGMKQIGISTHLQLTISRLATVLAERRFP